jgi:hypothetical protein
LKENQTRSNGAQKTFSCLTIIPKKMQLCSAMVKLHFHFFLSRRNLTLESVRFLFLPDRAKLLQFKSYLKKVYYGLHLEHCEREHYAGF